MWVRGLLFFVGGGGGGAGARRFLYTFFPGFSGYARRFGGGRPFFPVLRRGAGVEEKGEFLFDLAADPYEMKNLAADAAHLATLNQMREGMLLHLRSTQTNLSEGYKSKVQRLREAEGMVSPGKNKKKLLKKVP